MYVSAFDLFRIGLGPSSSHTMGPMRAARRFERELEKDGQYAATAHVTVDLYGSLGLTGRGHGTDRAVMLGLSGCEPECIEPAEAERVMALIRKSKSLALGGRRAIAFREAEHVRFRIDKSLSFHSNGMRFTARDENGGILRQRVYFSVGGGFVMGEQEALLVGIPAVPLRVPYPFTSAAELLRQGANAGKRIAEMMRINELALRSPEEVTAGLLERWQVMNACVERGMVTEGALPGGLNFARRAKKLRDALVERHKSSAPNQAEPTDWITVWALAVSEENAAGSRVVTAPTHGAAGVIPAVLRYYREYYEDANDEGVVDFLLTAAAIGGLCKRNASISGAEVGCQGEVGVACAMAAGGLTAALGGTNAQVENAAEIGMEHHLGMSCDPIGGLVQLPCIERNATGATRAVSAAVLALKNDGQHRVSLDAVIKTMYDTGREMMSRYKENSLGGLAVNAIDC